MHKITISMQFLKSFADVMSYLAESTIRPIVAVACPDDIHTLEAVEGALENGIADFIFVGKAGNPAAEELAAKYSGRVRRVEVADADEAAAAAVGLVREGKAGVLMKGLLNTDNLLRAVLNKQDGILTPGAVLSHITGAEIESMGRLIFFSDAAVIPNPTAEQLTAITGYLAKVTHAFGNPNPRIALIHCNEKTSPKFPVTLAYAEIKRQAAEGHFGNVVADGPMDLKTAFDSHSGQVKGIDSPVEGKADALVFPDIEAANVFYKTISFFADSTNAGMLMGAKAPVVLPSRSDSSRAKLCSLAMACLYAVKSS